MLHLQTWRWGFAATWSPVGTKKKLMSLEALKEEKGEDRGGARPLGAGKKSTKEGGSVVWITKNKWGGSNLRDVW